MKNYKVYGNENTHLYLSEYAQYVYSNTDPLEIREYETDNGYAYKIFFDTIETEFLSANEVEEFLLSDTEFAVCDHEAGNIISEHNSFEEALTALKEYEQEDIKDGNYTPYFYEVAVFEDQYWKTYYWHETYIH